MGLYSVQSASFVSIFFVLLCLNIINHPFWFLSHIRTTWFGADCTAGSSKDIRLAKLWLPFRRNSCRVWWLVFWDQWSYLWSVIGLPKNLQIERIKCWSMNVQWILLSDACFFQIFRDEKWRFLATYLQARLRPKTFVFDFQPAMTGARNGVKL